MKDEIIQLRKKGIGGSEVASILGLDEYGSPYKVWLAKTGRSDVHIDNKYIMAGNILEGAVAEYFQQVTGNTIIKASAEQKTYFHPKYPFALGTPDRRYIAKNQPGKGILECKTTQMTFDDVPMKWFTQLQWYLGVIGAQHGAVAWLQRGVDFNYKEYLFDQDYFDFMIIEVEKFWNENVLKDVEPDPINVEDIEKMFKKHTEGEIIQATPELIFAHSSLANIKEALSGIVEQKEKLEEEIKMVMRGAEAIMNGAKYLFTWKASKDSKKFDADSFKTDNPELYEKYLKDVPGSRRFLQK
jgi:putative phage-type endonuclease